MNDRKSSVPIRQCLVPALAALVAGLILGATIPLPTKETFLFRQQPNGLDETLAEFDREAWKCRGTTHLSDYGTNKHCRRSEILEDRLRDFSANNQFTYTTRQYFQLLRAKLLIREQKIEYLQET